MKKIIAAIVIITIIILIILGIRSCEPRKKTGGGDEYFNAFVNASVEYLCTVVLEPSINPESENAKELLNKIYEDHGLPVEEDEIMIEIYQKYQDNEDIDTAIEEKLNNCSDFN